MPAGLPCFVLLLISMVVKTPSLHEPQTYLRSDMKLFSRLVSQMRIKPDVAKLAIALWYSLEERGYELLESLTRCDGTTLKIIFDETTLCLQSIQPNAKEPSNLDQELRISKLVNKAVTRGFIYHHRDYFFRRVTQFLDTARNAIFHEHAAKVVQNPTNYAGFSRQSGKGNSSKAEISQWSNHVQGPSFTQNPFGRSLYATNHPLQISSDKNAAGNLKSSAVCFRPYGEGTSSEAETFQQGGHVPSSHPSKDPVARYSYANKLPLQVTIAESAPKITENSKKCAGVYRLFGENTGSESDTSQWPYRIPSLSVSLDPSFTSFFAYQFPLSLPLRDQRTLFLTFSHGSPLTKEEIWEFFAQKYGEVVEDVIVGDHQEKAEPEYARIVFNNVQTIPSIMKEEERVKFMVKGKHLWARLFLPRPRS